MYTDSISVMVHMQKESEKIRFKGGVRQGDTISPKFFTATLESIFRRLNCENKGVKIDGDFIANLHVADDSHILKHINTTGTTTYTTGTIRPE